MMYAKASSDDTATHKTCINNAKIMQNQSRTKMHRKRKNKSPKDALECKKTQKRICPLNKCTKSTNNANKSTKKHKKNTTKMHKECKTNAIKKQHKCNQKRSGLGLCMFFCFVFTCFCFRVLFCIFCAFPSENANKSHKNRTTNANKCKQIADKAHKHRKISHKKGGV